MLSIVDKVTIRALSLTLSGAVQGMSSQSDRLMSFSHKISNENQ